MKAVMTVYLMEVTMVDKMVDKMVVMMVDMMAVSKAYC